MRLYAKANDYMRCYLVKSVNMKDSYSKLTGNSEEKKEAGKAKEVKVQAEGLVEKQKKIVIVEEDGTKKQLLREQV